MSSPTTPAAVEVAREYTAREFEKALRLTPVFVDAALSTSSATLPYHGSQHLLATAIRAAEGGAVAERPFDVVAALFLAGLFHDAEYTSGAPESTNIFNAASYAITTLAGTAEQHLTPVVVELIEATAFPHTSSVSADGAIIRDADLLTSIEPDAAKFRDGLVAEQGFVDALFPPATLMSTDWGRELLASARAVEVS